MTPREPDRFDKQAREIWGARNFGGSTPIENIAAALRAAADERDEHWRKRIIFWFNDDAARAILDRALIPPAAAPAAVTIHPPTSCAPSATIPSPSTATLEDAGISQPTMYAAPAGETGKARCPFDEQDCLDARQLLRECEDALSTVGCHPDGEALAHAVLKKLRARVAPPKEPPAP